MSVLAAATLSASPAVAASSQGDSIQSPRLRRLEAERRSLGAAAVDSFWAEVSRVGAPLIEPLSERPRSPSFLPLTRPAYSDSQGVERGYSLVTFLWRSPREDRVILLDTGVGRGLGAITFRRLSDTDVWYCSVPPDGLIALLPKR
jgi:hypothetical protein